MQRLFEHVTHDDFQGQGLQMTADQDTAGRDTHLPSD